MGHRLVCGEDMILAKNRGEVSFGAYLSTVLLWG